jgi:hypothetical protein
VSQIIFFSPVVLITNFVLSFHYRSVEHDVPKIVSIYDRYAPSASPSDVLFHDDNSKKNEVSGMEAVILSYVFV